MLNGRAVHLNASRDWNEDNVGLGFEREFDANGRWVKVAMGTVFATARIIRPTWRAAASKGGFGSPTADFMWILEWSRS